MIHHHGSGASTDATTAIRLRNLSLTVFPSSQITPVATSSIPPRTPPRAR
jgi:hypothetical protein